MYTGICSIKLKGFTWKTLEFGLWQQLPFLFYCWTQIDVQSQKAFAMKYLKCFCWPYFHRKLHQRLVLIKISRKSGFLGTISMIIFITINHHIHYHNSKYIEYWSILCIYNFVFWLYSLHVIFFLSCKLR